MTNQVALYNEKIKRSGNWILADTQLPSDDGEYLTYAEKVGGWPKYRVNYFQVEVGVPTSPHWHWDGDYVVAWMPITPFKQAVKQEESWLGKAVNAARGGNNPPSKPTVWACGHSHLDDDNGDTLLNKEAK